MVRRRGAARLVSDVRTRVGTDLDPEWNSGYAAEIDVIDRAAIAHGTVTQAIASDGSVFVVGASHATSERGPSVRELNNDGSPAVGFGAGGTTFVGHGLGQEGGFEALTGAGIRPSFGQLLVAGSYGASFSRDHWAVARLKADGSLDESFGIGGIAEVETVGGYSTSLAPASVGAWRWIGRSLWADRVPPPPALLG